MSEPILASSSAAEQESAESGSWGWRRAPVPVIVVAILLAIPGLLTAIWACVTAFTGTGLSGGVIAGVVVAVVLCGVAAGLWFGGRAGYWLGVAVCGLAWLFIAAMTIFAAVTASEGVTALGILLGLLTVPNVLLALPAARRARASPEERAARRQRATPYGLAWPEGWTTPAGGPGKRPSVGGWLWLGLGTVVGVGALAGGVSAAVGGSSTEAYASAAAGIGFGLAVCLFFPGAGLVRLLGRVRSAHTQVGGWREAGVRFSYVFLYPLVAFVLASAGMATTSAMLWFFAEEVTDPFDRYGAGVLRVIGVAGTILFGLGVVASVVSGVRAARNRPRKVVLTQRSLAFVRGSNPTALYWEAIASVCAEETYRGQFVGIGTREARRAAGVPIERPESELDEAPQSDLLLPVDELVVSQLLLYHAVRFYHEHPEMRHELGTEQGLKRIRRGELHGKGAPVGADGE